MNIVLVQNETTVNGRYDHWRNVEGERYHFPNQYKNKVVEGSKFIYYRGVRRNNGRGTPEYFGCGTIGRVWLDPETDFDLPKNKWNWYCEILDYIPFSKPVPAKLDENYFEQIKHQNLWAVAVRNLPDEVYNNIMIAAGTTLQPKEEQHEPVETPPIKLVDIETVNGKFIAEDESLIVKPIEPTGKSKNGTTGNAPRRSKYSKIIGDRAEEVVLKELEKLGLEKLRWVANEKEKPGWDIEYYIGEERISIEVKGSSGKRFTNIEITAGEWTAATKEKNNYWLYLVADCLSNQPLIQKIQNPAALHEQKIIRIEPLLWKLTLSR